MSPRYSQVRRDTIEYCFWLIFDARGGVRMARGKPALKRDERGMSCTALLPRSLFTTPSLKATINIAEGGDTAFSIDIDAASDALRSALGVDIDLTVTDVGDRS